MVLRLLGHEFVEGIHIEILSEDPADSLLILRVHEILHELLDVLLEGLGISDAAGLEILL